MNILRTIRDVRRAGALLVSLVAASAAFAADITWTGANQDWADIANWMPHNVPKLVDTAYIPSDVPFFPVTGAREVVCSGIVLDDGAQLTVNEGGALYIVGPGDLDHDTIPDLSEVFTGNMDIDGDGLPNFDDPDSDGDMLPDKWEYQYQATSHGAFDPFIKPDIESPGHPGNDYDDDGFTNWQEYEAGTDPTNDKSFPVPLPVSGCLAMALAVCAIALLAALGFRKGGRWSWIAGGAVLVALLAAGGSLYAAGDEGGTEKAFSFVNFDAGVDGVYHSVLEAVVAAEPYETITIDGGSDRPWNGITTYVTRPVTLAAAGGTVYLGGIRTAVAVAVDGEGSVLAESLYVLPDHPASVKKTVEYGEQPVACFRGEKLIVTSTPAAGWGFREWLGDLSGDSSPVEFQAASHGLGITAVFSLPIADLIVSWETGPPSPLRADQSIPALTFHVENRGELATECASWTDGVYLSRDVIFDARDLELNVQTRTSALGAGDSYTVDVPETTFPDVAPGEYYLLAVTDTEGDVAEYEKTQNTKAAPVVVNDAVLAQ